MFTNTKISWCYCFHPCGFTSVWAKPKHPFNYNRKCQKSNYECKYCYSFATDNCTSPLNYPYLNTLFMWKLTKKVSRESNNIEFTLCLSVCCPVSHHHKFAGRQEKNASNATAHMIYVFGPMTRLEITHLDLGWGGAHTEAEWCAKRNLYCRLTTLWPQWWDVLHFWIAVFMLLKYKFIAE